MLCGARFGAVCPCAAPGKAVPPSRWLCRCTALDHPVSLHPHMLASFVLFAAASRPSMIAGATRQATPPVTSDPSPRLLAPAQIAEDDCLRALARGGVLRAHIVAVDCCHRTGVGSGPARKLPACMQIGISRIACTPRRPKLAPAHVPRPLTCVHLRRASRRKMGESPRETKYGGGRRACAAGALRPAVIHPSPSACVFVPSSQIHHADAPRELGPAHELTCRLPARLCMCMLCASLWAPARIAHMILACSDLYLPHACAALPCAWALGMRQGFRRQRLP